MYLVPTLLIVTMLVLFLNTLLLYFIISTWMTYAVLNLTYVNIQLAKAIGVFVI